MPLGFSNKVLRAYLCSDFPANCERRVQCSRDTKAESVQVTSEVTFDNLRYKEIQHYEYSTTTLMQTTNNKEQGTRQTVCCYVLRQRKSNYPNSSLVIEHDDHKHKTLTDERPTGSLELFTHLTTAPSQA